MSQASPAEPPGGSEDGGAPIRAEVVEHPAVRASARPRRGLSLSERRLALAALDAAVVGVAWIVAFNLRTAEVRNAFPYLPRLGTVIAVACWLAAGSLFGAYDLRGPMTMRGALRPVLGTAGLATLALLGVFFLDPYRITRPTIVLWAPLAAAGALAARAGYRRVLLTSEWGGYAALVAPRGRTSAAMQGVLDEVGRLYSIVQYVDADDPACTSEVLALVGRGAIDQLIVGVRDDVSRPLFRALVACSEHGVRVRSLADVYEELTGRMLLDELGHSWLMSIPMRGETSRLYAMFKRGTDLLAGVVGLCVMLVVLPFVALGDLLLSRGPIFYGQRRVGKYGEVFQLWKFRTMRSSAMTEWTRENDPRVTPFGRVLRRLHVDELPQALNILRGEMSVIGPRPEQPHYVEQLASEIDYYRTRLVVRPGLTGWAQVHYGYGSGIGGTRVKLSYDLYYVKRQSVSLDVAILFRTLATVLSFGGR